jgi:hypothetical protein
LKRRGFIGTLLAIPAALKAAKHVKKEPEFFINDISCNSAVWDKELIDKARPHTKPGASYTPTEICDIVDAQQKAKKPELLGREIFSDKDADHWQYICHGCCIMRPEGAAKILKIGKYVDFPSRIIGKGDTIEDSNGWVFVYSEIPCFEFDMNGNCLYFGWESEKLQEIVRIYDRLNKELGVES